MTGFIVVAIDKDSNKIYVSNTSPICWSNNIKEAKLFDTYNSALYDIEDDFISLSSTIYYAKLQNLYIIELEDNIEKGGYKLFDDSNLPRKA